MSSLFIISRSPEDPLMGPVMDLIFSAVAFGQQPQLLFMQQGLGFFSPTAGNAKSLPQLVEYGEFECFYLGELSPPPAIKATAITAAELPELIAASDCAQSF